MNTVCFVHVETCSDVVKLAQSLQIQADICVYVFLVMLPKCSIPLCVLTFMNSV
jgi:hypothetical protein